MSSSVGGVDSAPLQPWVARERRDDERQQRFEKPATTLDAGTARRTAPTAPMTQLDFEVAGRLINPAAGRTVDQLAGVPKLDRKPLPEPGNPYSGILGALRTAAARRDAALVLAERG